MIKKSLKDSRWGTPTDDEFTRDTDSYFASRCGHFGNMCNEGVLISLYVSDMKIRIHTGPKIKDFLSISAREKMISGVKSILQLGNYAHALEDIVTSIKNYTENPKKANNSSYYYNSHSNYGKVEEGTGFGMLFFVVFGMIMLGLMCFNIFSTTKKSKKLEKIQLNVYAQFLVNLLQEIRKSHDRTILTDQCLACAKTFGRYDPAAYDAGRSHEALRFGCGHIYHRGCLDRIVSFKCLCCIESMNSTTYARNMNENNQYISELDLLRFIDNLPLIYTKADLNEFCANYPESKNTFESNFGISFEKKFGCNDYTGKVQSGDVKYPAFQEGRGDTAAGNWGEQKGATAAGDWKEKGDTAGGEFGHGRW